MGQIAELIGPLINGQLIKQYQRTGSSHLSELTAQQEIVHHKPLGKVFGFCELTAAPDKQIAGGLLDSYLRNNEEYVLHLCVCHLWTRLSGVGRPGEHSKQPYRCSGGIELTLRTELQNLFYLDLSSCFLARCGGDSLLLGCLSVKPV